MTQRYSDALVFGGLASSASGTASAMTSPTATAGFVTGAVSAPSWVSSLMDPVIRADMTAASAGGAASEVAMARLFSDLAVELTVNNTTLSAGQLIDLQTIAADLNTGETVSSYVTYITDALIVGNAANAQWTGGTSSSTALGNLAIGATATQLNELVGKWFLGTDLPSSTVAMSGTQTYSVSYSAVTNAVFGASGPSMNDINQGYLGDCYLLASLAEVARQDPTLVQSMITSNGNNTYGVRFFVNGSARYVTVNNFLADGGTVFNGAADIWASLVEKAYAQLQASGVTTGNTINYGNSFSTIGNGGAPDLALEAITGASAITNFYASGSCWNKYVLNSTFATQSATSGLTTASVLATLAADLAAGRDAVLSSWTNATDSSGRTTLVGDHAMSIYGYDSTTGNLEIRNPWGTEPGQSWDTTFEVSLNTLLANGDSISVDNTTPAAPPPPLPASPLVTLYASPTASNTAAAALGTATPGSGTDALKVTLTSDADFAAGSALALSNGILSYTPGLVTAAQAGTDTLTYSVTDTVTGAVTTETQTVAIEAPVRTRIVDGTPGAHSAVTFNGQSSDYTVTYDGNGTATVTDNGAEGDGTVISVGNEALLFTDHPDFIESGDGANIARLYLAGLGRIPDQTGLFGWENYYSSDVSATAKAQGVYVALSETSGGFNGNLSIADGIIQSPEFQAAYGSLSNAAFITQLYAHVLGRAPDPTGLAGWLTDMTPGNSGGTTFTQAMVLVGLAESPENIANSATWLTDMSKSG